MVLAAGDIAIIAYNSDGNDDFAWVTLVDIPANTTINFTDSSWQDTGFRTTEHLDAAGGGPLTWSHSSTVTAGTVIKWDGLASWNVGTSSGTTLSLSALGDQIFIYTGTVANPVFIYGAHFATTTNWLTSGSNSTNTSNIPPGLSIAAGTAFYIGNFDNGYYTGTTTGTKAELLAAISNTANWQRNDTGPLLQSNWKTAFTVAGGLPTVELLVSSNVGTEAGQTVITVTAKASSPVSGDQTIDLTVTGTGITAGDYTFNSNTITILNGQTEGSVTFTVFDDALPEGTETATLTLTNPSGGIIANGSAIVTIADNDSANTAPIIQADNEIITDPEQITPFLKLPDTSPSGSPGAFVSGVINDPTDPARTIGIEFNISDAETAASSLIVTATSSNQSVVTDANLTITGTGNSRNLKITPTGVGYSDITVTVSDGSLTESYVIKYAASAAGTTSSRFLTGASNASTVVAIGSNYMFVADDENQRLRLYDRNNSGLPLQSFDFTSSLGLTDISGGVPREVDIEAATRVGNRIFWLGSLSNSDSGNNRPNRDRIFGANIAGTGVNTILNYVGRYDFLKEDIIAWDANNLHGKGANYYGLAASAATGVGAKQSNSFNVEGLEMALDNTTAYIAFRAPQVTPNDRTKALIVPVTNFTSLLSGSGGTQGSATFGTPIELDLGGRGIREIRKNAANEYVIIAGTAGDATGTAPSDFRLYTWTGNANDAPQLRAADLSGILSGGSVEGIVEVPDSLTDTSQIQLIIDNGDTVWYNDGTIAKDLTQANYQKSRSEVVTLGTVVSNLTPIHHIQGSGDTSPLSGQTVTIEGVVVADFQLNNQLRGFFVQEEDTDRDGDLTTSEAIFVFTGSNSPLDVQEGQIVRVTGTVSEFFNMTQVSATTAGSITLVNGGNNLSLVTPTTINLPVTGDVNAFYEQYEGMLVKFANKFYVSEYFEVARYGQIVLTADGRPFQYSHTDNTPTAAEYKAFLNDLNRKRIILDDDDNTQNSPLNDGVGKFFYPQPGGFGTGTQGTNYFRGGDSISNLTGVLHWSFAGQSGTDAWRIRPTQANPITFTTENPRPKTPPDVGGNIKVASFNVLNYFNTIDTVGGDGSPRGADSVDEFNRQNEKLIAALIALNADVVGFMEIENNGDAATSAVKELVNRLNAQLGANIYDYINTGNVGTDQITVAFIYKSSVVEARGAAAILTDPAFTDPNNTGQQRSRPAIAQTFRVIDSNNADFGESFNVVVNHLKSKGADGATGADSDQLDGQGAWNDTRTKAASYLVNTWIKSDPTGQGDPDFLIIGDLNAYKGETPITAIKNAGYTDLVESYGGNNAYGYVFNGQLGYLDHALANASLASQVTGVTEWHINADEVPVFDYNNSVDDGAGEASFEAKPTGNNLYESNPFRTSDHDPVIIGLNLNSIPPGNNAPIDLTLSTTSVNENVPDNTEIGIFNTIDPDQDDTFTYTLVDETPVDGVRGCLKSRRCCKKALSVYAVNR